MADSLPMESAGRESEDSETEDVNFENSDNDEHSHHDLPEEDAEEENEEGNDDSDPQDADADTTENEVPEASDDQPESQTTLTEFAQLVHDFQASHLFGEFDPRVLVPREEMEIAEVVEEEANLAMEFGFSAQNPQDAGYEFEEPTSFDGAWNHENANERRLWRAAIQKEFADMERRNVWNVIDRTQMPRDRRCVKCKWVLKIKRDGRHRARSSVRARAARSRRRWWY